MNNYRKTAISAGELLIIATVVNVLGNVAFLDPILSAPDYLVRISGNENQVILGGLLVFFSALSSASIAICLYPVLKKQHEALALGSAGFRVVECMLYILGVVCLLSLLALSQEYVKTGASNASLVQVSGTVLLSLKKWADQLSVIAFTTGALMYYLVFYQSRLVPRWLSGWGFLAAALSLATALLGMLGRIIPMSTLFILMQLPIAMQEMVLAVWLLVKGFNPSAVASLSAKTAANELISAS